MSGFTLVDPKGWDCDLQSVYSAYMGHFQLHNIPWYDRSWGVLFESFEEFLTFSWPTITVTDCWTGKAHIVVRLSSIGAFLKMLKTRFGETLPMVDNILRISPFETSQRHLRNITDYASYKKIFATLPAAVLSALKIRVRNGEPKAIRELWSMRDKTFLAIDFEWSERNQSSCLEWGYAAVRCGHLETAGVWPPDPEPNYRRGHYIVSEYADKIHNRYRPNYPWAYVFGESQVIPKAKLSTMIEAIISSLISPDSETVANTLVLVMHGINGDLRRLEEMKIKIPHNLLIIDTATFERQLFNTGQRGPMQDPSGKPREQNFILSLSNLLVSLGVDVQRIMHNSGNDAFMTLLALHLLLDPDNTKIPTPKFVNNMSAQARIPSRSPSVGPGSPPMGIMPAGTTSLHPGMTPDGYMEQISGRPASYLATQRSISDFGPHKFGALLPQDGRGRSGSRLRVSSMNDVNEVRERLAAVNLKQSTLNPTPNSR
ncbi:Good for full DBP5 activity protein 2 [Grifola frondosa]|uniref:Good for full DBP5 activity protein 2 n=1 Tax=Grifola frondosa TaxID=5627 RepID=A0A1C7MS93_GRIFR|nr:Good for full DBP5 activity protein 2 [Grifola frondosa]